jgi:glycosyltransferase involved in cell wall biosynthesis
LAVGLQALPPLGAAAASLGALLVAGYVVLERLGVRPDVPALGELRWSGTRARRVVVMPAYNAEKTVRDVVARIPHDQIDGLLLVDDASWDGTAPLARDLGIPVIRHPRNLGYGGNQKTCYTNALLMGAEVVVMLHPDGQYDPELVPDLCRPIDEGRADVVLGSRWLGLDPAKAGMPGWKRLGNRFLTSVENRVLGLDLSEYHTGYRAYSRRFLETIPFEVNANDFVFDTQVLVQAASFGFRIAEVPAVGRYFEDMSSVGLRTSVVYGLETLAALVAFLAHRAGWTSAWLAPRPRRRRPQPSLVS